MTIETDIVAALGGLVGGRIHPATKVPTGTSLPYVSYQNVGGAVINPINGSAPGRRFSRIQFNCWARSQQQANTLMRQIEDLCRPYPLNGRPDGGLMDRSDPITNFCGAQQDITFFW